MPEERCQNNINRLFLFLQDILHRRLSAYFKKEDGFSFPSVEIEPDDTPLQQFLLRCQPDIHEYVILALALIPHVVPNFIDGIVQQYLPSGGDLPEMGGVKGNHHRGTLPTGETALFIIAGNNLDARMTALRYFSPDHFFAKENILQLETVREGEPKMSGRLMLQSEYAELFTTGVASRPSFGADFPAKLITTKMEWQNLVLNSKTRRSLENIKTWLHHNAHFMDLWGMDKVIKPGYRALFYGPPGPGKTLTATLLGKQFDRELYRIDLSMVVSKYIGETEKNLEKVFVKAENKNWILFFDEADALFGKRSNVQNAHDKYANQEVSYLLQRVEDFPGLIILASNFKSVMDPAFLRRFNNIVHFPMPDQAERHELWRCSIPARASLADDVNLADIAHRYELSGSAIVSVIHYASLQTIHQGQTLISKQDIIDGIKREYEKEERVFG